MESQNQQESIFQNQQSLPNATAVLVLGILSIVGCCFYGSGLIFGIIALVLAGKDKKLYAANPEGYTQSSYKNLNAGRVCAIIGTIISALSIAFTVIVVGMFGWEAMNNPELLKQKLGA